MLDIRLRSAVPDAALSHLEGRLLEESDYDLLLKGPARLAKPNGDPLLVYLPGAMREWAEDEATSTVLRGLRSLKSHNRGKASGTKRVVRDGKAKRSSTRPTPSALIGAFDDGRDPICRLTAWTGQHLPEWEALRPSLQAVAQRLQENVPARYQAQAKVAQVTNPAWLIPGTPFTTVTVNNTYPTGVHKDAGDLEDGFSTLWTLRYGDWTGGTLIFPRYRVGVNLAHGDLLLMDAHEYHGNTAIRCACMTDNRITLSDRCDTCNAERVSVVSYYRTRLANCGTPQQEQAKQHARAAKRSGLNEESDA